MITRKRLARVVLESTLQNDTSVRQSVLGYRGQKQEQAERDESVRRLVARVATVVDLLDAGLNVPTYDEVLADLPSGWEVSIMTTGNERTGYMRVWKLTIDGVQVDTYSHTYYDVVRYEAAARMQERMAQAS